MSLIQRDPVNKRIKQLLPYPRFLFPREQDELFQYIADRIIDDLMIHLHCRIAYPMRPSEKSLVVCVALCQGAEGSNLEKAMDQ